MVIYNSFNIFKLFIQYFVSYFEFKLCHSENEIIQLFYQKHEERIVFFLKVESRLSKCQLS
jgi:hypothetical protein